MTIVMKKRILQRMQTLEHDIDALKRAQIEIATNGFASASLSSQGGSKSWTRLNLKDLTDLLRELTMELTKLQNLLTTGTTSPFKHIYTVYV